MEQNNMKKNAIWNTIGVTLNSFMSLFFLVIINRINGIDVGGIFSYAFSVSCLLFIVGVYATRTFQISDVEKKFNDVEYFVSKISTCGLMVIISFIFTLFIEGNDKKSAIIIFTLFKALEAFSDTLYGYMQKKDRLYLSGVSMTLKTICSILIFLVVDLKTNDFVLSGFCMLIAPLLITVIFDGKNAKKCVDKEKLDLKNSFKIFYYGFPIFIISFLSVYIVNSQKYVMDGILDASAQTIFGIILMPATFISLCGQYIMNPILTELIHLYKQKEYREFKKKLNNIIKLLFCFWVLAEVGAFFLGIPVFNFLYAIELENYKKALLLILLGALFYSVSIIYQNTLIVMKKNKFQVIIYTVSALISFVSAKLLITMYGIYGAVYSYVLTMFMHCLIYCIYFEYELRKNKEVNV